MANGGRRRAEGDIEILNEEDVKWGRYKRERLKCLAVMLWSSQLREAITHSTMMLHAGHTL